MIIIVLSIALVASMGMTILTYVRLTAEEPIAKMYFEPLEDDVFEAHLAAGEGGDVGIFEIYGDQWRIDAEFIKLKPWANVMGMDARYKLVRFEGRYRDIEDENTKPKMAYDLVQDDALDLMNYLAEWNFLVDAEYGSSTFTDIKQDTLYSVYRTQSGIIVRYEPMPDPIGYEPTMIDKVTNWISDRSARQSPQ
ncbi:hypothetical protein P8T57_03405 [Thalassospira sp. SN3W]|uniref:hypothetical protein n=1 Tax=Thalassospira sp. SN3W TaxID=3035476 RepID=UPI00311B3F47